MYFILFSKKVTLLNTYNKIYVKIVQFFFNSETLCHLINSSLLTATTSPSLPTLVPQTYFKCISINDHHLPSLSPSSPSPPKLQAAAMTSRLSLSHSSRSLGTPRRGRDGGVWVNAAKEGLVLEIVISGWDHIDPRGGAKEEEIIGCRGIWIIWSIFKTKSIKTKTVTNFHEKLKLVFFFFAEKPYYNYKNYF